MATISEILANRETAGARYLAALVELRAAYVDLASIDFALSNGRIARNDIKTFRGDLDGIPVSLQHPKYAPEHNSGIVSDVRGAGETILKRFSPATV